MQSCNPAMTVFCIKTCIYQKKVVTLREISRRKDTHMDDSQILCTVLTPYIEFKDGTMGCILVLYRQKGIPSVFLFNSPHRQGNNHSANQKFLFQYEYDLLVRYINGVEKHGYPHNKELKDTYNDYGVARLCTNFIGICLKDIISRTENGHMPRIQLSQLSHIEGVKERLASAKMQYTTYELEDELLFYADDITLWERSILEQAMLQLSPPVDPKEWFESLLKTIRTTFVGSIQNVTSVSFGVDYGYRLAAAYAKDPDVKWWRILERTVSMKYPEEGINYSQFGFQEIVAFYGLTQYIAAQQPFNHLTLDVGRVPLSKRIELYDAYKNNIEKECLDVLRSEDNPLSSRLPSKQDAQKVAKEIMARNYGRTPNWLPEDCRQDYASYDQAFYNPSDDIASKDKKKVPYAKERIGIRAVFDSHLCKSKSDWGAVFKILVEREFCSKKAYLAGAKFINEVCGIDVTTKDALRQSPALNILGGNAESGWRNREPENRESSGKLLHYREIAIIFFSAI